MTVHKPITEAQFEALSDAYDAFNRADVADDRSVEAARVAIRAQNRLIDACVDCGMALDGDEFAFAAEIVTAWLTGRLVTVPTRVEIAHGAPPITNPQFWG